MEIQRIRRRKEEEKFREMEVMIISAQNLKNVKHIHKMRPYAEVYVERHVHVARTAVDDRGDTDPTWNEVVTVKFHDGLPESDVMAALNVDIYARGRVRDKLVGSARVLLCDALKGGDPADNPIQCTTVRVWRESGRPQGMVHLWVPPTGRFLMRRESLSFSIKEEVGPEEEMVVASSPEEEEETVAPPEEKAVAGGGAVASSN